RAWVTVARFSPGQKEVIGRFEDALLAGLEVYEDPYLCSGGQLMGLASGSDTAVLDPRPLFHAHFCAHPYDLAALVVARAAGVVVEALPPGPLDVPLDPNADVAWAGDANESVADASRGRSMPPIPARSMASRRRSGPWGSGGRAHVNDSGKWKSSGGSASSGRSITRSSNDSRTRGSTSSER